jgi:hypothetical protein
MPSSARSHVCALVGALVSLEIHFGFRLRLRVVFAYIGQLLPNLRQSL